MLSSGESDVHAAGPGVPAEVERLESRTGLLSPGCILGTPGNFKNQDAWFPLPDNLTES